MAATRASSRDSSIEASAFNEANEQHAQGRQKKAEGEPGAARRHEGLARDRIVPLGGVVPRDHPRPHRRRDQGQARSALGLKENVIIGKLIPAGTGMSRYRNIEIEPEGQDLDDEGRPRHEFEMAFARMTADDAALAEVMGGNGDGMSRLVSAYERNREPPTVQYEGEYEDHVTPHAAPRRKPSTTTQGYQPRRPVRVAR